MSSLTVGEAREEYLKLKEASMFKAAEALREHFLFWESVDISE